MYWHGLKIRAIGGNTVVNNANVYNYVFNYQDHLGNNRVSYTWNTQTSSLTILEENHYYPYGLKHNNYNLDQEYFVATGGGAGIRTQVSPYKYRFNGQEYQDELGLNIYMMDLRQYDPALARWTIIDPVDHLSLSPYNAFDNNPVFWADPSGGDSESSSFGQYDDLGRPRYDQWGTFIPVNERKFSRDSFLGLLEQRWLEKEGYSPFKNRNGEVVMRKTYVYASISKVETEYGEKDELFLKYGYEYLHLSVNTLGSIYETSFSKGFFHGDKSNFKSLSSWTGYASLHVSKTESLLKYVGATDDVLNVTKSLGKKLGYAGVLFTGFEDLQSDKVGVGTGVKAIIGFTTTILGTAFPIATLTYTILDITVGMATGTTLTDRIANGIENATKD